MTHARFEAKVASILVAIVVYLMAAVVHFASGDPLHVALAARGRDGDWAAVLAVLATMVLYGAVRPKRTCRHIGLVLTMLMMAAMAGLVLQAGVTTPLTMSVLLTLLLVPVAGWLFAADVLLGLRYRAER